MTSTLLQQKRSQKSAISAQALLELEETVIKSGQLRKRAKINIGKWPHRLVVLTYDSIYIYIDENAKAQNSKFSLCGYNQVKRCEVKGQQWCFCIVPALNMESLVAKTFACVSDADRKTWMKAIKNQMYAANQVPKPSPSFTDKLKSGVIISDDDYNSLEKLVYSPTEGIHQTVGDPSFSDEDDDDDDRNSSSGSQTTTRETLKFPDQTSVHKAKVVSTDPASDLYETYDDVVDHPSNKTTAQAVKKQNLDPFLRQSSQPAQNKSSDSDKPPRYSEVYYEEDVYTEAETHEYANLGNSTQSLESMCTIVDKNLNRDELIKLLLTKESGTYLIRKSRQSDEKVISFKHQNGQVKEYKIHGTTDCLSLESKRPFSSVEDLLRYYTLVDPLPSSTEYLRKGIHQ